MLLDSIKRMFGTQQAEPVDAPPPGVEPLHLAACVLLLDIAHADGEFSDAERTHIERVLERHFSLPAEAGKALMELADRIIVMEDGRIVEQGTHAQLIRDGGLYATLYSLHVRLMQAPEPLRDG